jgi:hypothetical protein
VNLRAIETWLADHPKVELHERLFGSATPEAIASFIVDAVASIIPMEPRSIFEYQVGLVASAGVELPDDQRIFVKVYPDTFERWPVLLAARSVQEHQCKLHRDVPSPIAIRRVQSTYVAIDQYLPGDVLGCRDGTRRQVIAARLAELIDAAPSAASLPALSQSRLHLHPAVAHQPEDPDDFQGPRLHFEAVLRAATSDLVVAHLDLRVQNIAWAGEQVAAIYDWDSVALTSEEGAVGAAAGMFSYDFRDAVPHVPRPDEVQGFIDDYHAVRSINTTAASAAAALKMLGYASWEHRLDPSGSRLGERSYRSALRRSWDEYMSVFGS